MPQNCIDGHQKQFLSSCFFTESCLKCVSCVMTIDTLIGNEWFGRSCGSLLEVEITSSPSLFIEVHLHCCKMSLLLSVKQ